jgi:hypothetical protein
MDQQSKKAPGRSAIVLPSKQSKTETQNDSVERRNWIAEMVAATVEAMGTELSAPALNLFVTDLLPLADEAIVRALTRSRREIRGKNGFPPTLTIADVLDRAGVVTEAEVEDSQCRAAWDLVQQYISRHVVRDSEGIYVERDFVGNRGRVPMPELSQRIRDTVRRVGGWRVLVNPSEDDLPHVQRRFYEEYRAWAATEQASIALKGDPSLQRLAAKVTMPGLHPKSRDT